MRALRFSDAAAGWVLVAVALGVTAYSALTVSPVPLGPTEATYRLQAESLARDGDSVYEERDRVRFAEKDWPDREAKVIVSFDRDVLRYHRPLPYAFALAPFVRFAPERGPYFLNLFLLAGLSLALCVRLSRDSPRGAPYWAGALVFATPVFAYARAVWPELFVGVVLACAYLLTRDQAPLDELPQMAPIKAGWVGTTLRWFAVGGLLSLAALHDPLYLAFFAAFLVLAVRIRAAAAFAPTIGGLALVLLTVWFTGGTLFAGVAPWAADTGLPVRAVDGIEDVTQWTQRLESVEAPELVVDPRLWLWNSVYSLGGRHVGVVAAFLPLILFAASGRWRSGLLWGAVAAVLLLASVLDPFNFFGGPEALSNRRLLPALILCFFSVRASPSVWPSALAGFLGLAMVFPLWLELGEHPRKLRGSVVVAPAAAALPFETSQRYAPTTGEAVSRLLLVRPTNDGIEPSAGETQFLLRSGRRGELMVAATGALAHLDLEFGARSATELEFAGEVEQELLLRPDGGVTFRLKLEDALIRHRIWGRPELHHVYILQFSMPGAEGQDQGFSVSAQPGGKS